MKGLDAFNELYADSRKWLQEGWVDYFAPQLYWPINAPNQSFPGLLKWWGEQNTKSRHLWPADSLTMLSTNRSSAEIINKILLSRSQSGVSGNVHFNFGQLQRNTAGIADALLAQTYAEPALVPASTWLSDSPTPTPEFNVEEQTTGVKLTWNSSTNSIRFWVLQTKTGGSWATDLLPGGTAGSVLNSFPEMLALSALDRCGILSQPVILARTK